MEIWLSLIGKTNKQEGYPAIAMKANGIKVKKDVVFLLNTNKIIPLKCFLYAFLSRRTLPDETEEPNGEKL